VRGLMNSRGIGEAGAGEPCDLSFLRGQLVERLCTFAHRLAGRQELAPGTLGECVGTEFAEHLIVRALGPLVGTRRCHRTTRHLVLSDVAGLLARGL
jgi:hypothetical protein